MAMNKAEKERMAELETALALHWPAYAAPRPMSREEIEAAKVELPIRDKSVYRERWGAIGWFYNANTAELTQGWSDGVSHNRRSVDGSSASQNMGCMYSTREAAAMAMRIEMSRDFAAQLARVDRIIRGEA